MNLYDTKTTKNIEQKLIKKNRNGFLLMMRCASVVLNCAKKKLSGRLWCVAGPGNNGGDAISVASLAIIENIDVRCIKLLPGDKGSSLAYSFSKNINLKIEEFLPDLRDLRQGDVIIDGVFGIGISRPPKGVELKAIEWINKARDFNLNVISIDVPSGLNATNGQPFGAVVKADTTVMCLTRKQGCYTGQAPELAGHLIFSDLGVGKRSQYHKGNSFLLCSENLVPPKRSPVSHKGDFGNVLVLGGWGGMEGAGFLAGIASLRVGAGKVYICGPSSIRLPLELINIPRNIDEFESIISKVDVILAGPGMGVNADKFIELAWNSDLPLVLDADGLKWLSRRGLKERRKSFWFGTPHHGEATALLGEKLVDRFEILSKLYKKYGGKWVLKGPGTLIGPDPIFINPFANSILSTAGSGDVLAGIIAGLISQKVTNPELLGVYIHSEAARKILSTDKNTMIASDMLKEIRTLSIKLN